MLTNYEAKLRRMYDLAEEKMAYFKRNYYEQAFNKYSSEIKDILDELNSELEGKDEETVTSYTDELSDLFVGIFKTEYDAIAKKGKKSKFVTDHNTPLVIYVFPAILEYSAKWCKPCVEAIVNKWNKAFTEVTLGYGTFSDIKGGFKTKLCYITTAVCESRNKADDCVELNLLRDYRDNVLAKEEGGEDIIKQYYDIAPTIVKRINRLNNSKEIYDGLYRNYILECINDIENKEYDKCRESYIKMVSELKSKYAY